MDVAVQSIQDSKETICYPPSSPRIDLLLLMCTLSPATLGFPTLQSLQLVIISLYSQWNNCFSLYRVSSETDRSELDFPSHAQYLQHSLRHMMGTLIFAG